MVHVVRLHADHRRSRRARARPRAASSPASSIACRTTNRSRASRRTRVLAMEGLALTGAWVDREGTRVDHRARNGRLVRSVRAAQARRAGRADGPDRNADGNRRRTKPCCSSGGGLGNAVLFSIGQALREAGSRVLYFAGYKQDAGPLQGGRDRGGGRRHRLVLRRSARLRAGRARRTAPSSATSCKRWSPTRSGKLGETADRAGARWTASSPSAPTG